MVGTEADLRKQETSRQLAKMEMLVEPVDKPMWLNKAIKVPIGEIATLGAACAHFGKMEVRSAFPSFRVLSLGRDLLVRVWLAGHSGRRILYPPALKP